MIKIVLAMIIGFALSNGSSLKHTGCDLSPVGEFSVSFQAYKTPSKIGVNGKFDRVHFQAILKTGKNFREIFVGSTVDIETASVNSNHKERDMKLVTYFFNNMSKKNIAAKIIDITSDKRVKGKLRTGTLVVSLTMNGVTKEVPMTYTYLDGFFDATGVVDILDFSASSALNSINKACYKLHKGKTWSDVSIGFSTHIEALLCSSKLEK